MVSTHTVLYLPSLVRRKGHVRESSTILCGCGAVDVSNSEGVSLPEAGRALYFILLWGGNQIHKQNDTDPL